MSLSGTSTIDPVDVEALYHACISDGLAHGIRVNGLNGPTIFASSQLEAHDVRIDELVAQLKSEIGRPNELCCMRISELPLDREVADKLLMLAKATGRSDYTAGGRADEDPAVGLILRRR